MFASALCSLAIKVLPTGCSPEQRESSRRRRQEFFKYSPLQDAHALAGRPQSSRLATFLVASGSRARVQQQDAKCTFTAVFAAASKGHPDLRRILGRASHALRLFGRGVHVPFCFRHSVVCVVFIEKQQKMVVQKRKQQRRTLQKTRGSRG